MVLYEKHSLTKQRTLYVIMLIKMFVMYNLFTLHNFYYNL